MIQVSQENQPNKPTRDNGYIKKRDYSRSENYIQYNADKRFVVKIQDIYKWFYIHKWDQKRRDQISIKTYILFITTFMQLLFDRIIKENFIFNIPFNLGSIYIRKYFKESGNRIKKHHYRLPAEEREAHPNRHTFGNSFSIYWDKELAIIPNKGLHSFDAEGSVKKVVHDHIFELAENNIKTSYDAHLGGRSKRIVGESTIKNLVKQYLE